MRHTYVMVVLLYDDAGDAVCRTCVEKFKLQPLLPSFFMIFSDAFSLLTALADDYFMFHVPYRVCV